ncbi:ABC transporter ATP-binding protein [Aquihabitans sp. McL0605]|uniref:ABC transporter ATP-binding protein n=1 Tax=Aquihabitans sp. McL0605 TaxID=3415671 RepID=UPI003CF2C7EF
MTDTSTAAPLVAPVVELEGVRRRFGEVDALAGLDLVVPANQITVLLGPNGAGKTTAIRMITGALDPHAGVVKTFGLDPSAYGEEVRRRCGVVSAKPALYDRLDGHANLAYSAELYGLGRGDHIDRRIRDAAARFGIEHALDKRVGGFSTGMKTRLALARSILHEPDLLLFDEPTSGLDPESSHAVLDMIREMTDDGRTVVMCTHLLLEAEGLADKVIVMEDGKDLISGTPIDLTRQFWPGTVVLVGAEAPIDPEPLRTIPGVRQLEPDSEPNRIRVHLDGDHRVPDLIVALAAAGIRLTRVEPISPTLEDLYFAVRTKKAIAADGGRQLSSDDTAGPEADDAPPLTDRNRQVAALTGWPGSEGSR